MIINLKTFIKKSLELNGIKIKDKSSDKIISLLADYTNTLIFNIASIASILALLNKSKKVKKEMIVIINNYINSKFKLTSKSYNSKGGADVLPPKFFGETESAYSTSNPTNDVLKVNFADGIARPAIGGSRKKIRGGSDVLPPKFFGETEPAYSASNSTNDVLIVDYDAGIARPAIGGGGSSSNIIKSYIQQILKHYGASASNDIINQLLKIFENNFKILIKEIKRCGDKITIKSISNIIESNKNLEILK